MMTSQFWYHVISIGNILICLIVYRKKYATKLSYILNIDLSACLWKDFSLSLKIVQFMSGF